LAYSPTACSFLMISPKLYAIWPILFLILPQYFPVVGEVTSFVNG
jgi:hypothetical protein